MAEVASYLSRKKVAQRALIVDDKSYARTTECHWLPRDVWSSAMKGPTEPMLRMPFRDLDRVIAA